MDPKLEKLLGKLNSAFVETYGSKPSRYFQAPGRVNLIGEHTDYNDGFVLPCAIDFQTMVAVTPRSDMLVHVIAVDINRERDVFRLDTEIQHHSSQMWSNYVRGVVRHLQLRGHKFTGADIAIAGNVPQGSGLSSSASLEVVIGETFKVLYDLPINKADIAINGQEAENQFVGCQCGIMDQMCSSCGEESMAMLLDCRSLDVKLIPMPEDLAVMIINSNVKRGLVDSEYNIRREQCDKAAILLGINALRDITLAQLKPRLSELPEVIGRRAQHVVSENERVLKMAIALSKGDYNILAQCMKGSHLSMKDDFEITVAPIDYIVEVLSHYLGDKGGVRMTGGGFGGCVVALMPHELIDGAIDILEAHYKLETGYQEVIYVCKASDGAGEYVVVEKNS